MCSGITTVAIYAAETEDAEEYLISGDFEYAVLEDGTAEITGYLGSGNTVTVPGTVDGLSVTSIGSRAFAVST